MIDLTHAVVLGEGNERRCVVHPGNPGLVIKVSRPDRSGRQQNVIEHQYLSSLQRRQASFAHVPIYHGVCATTSGEGLVCERIADGDGNSSTRVDVAVQRGLLTREIANSMLDALLDHLLQQWIVFADVGGGNVVCQQQANGALRLVIIDGLGARHPGFKLWIQSTLPWIARAKTRKQWPKLLSNIWSTR
jgi:hypothetical protein